MIVRLLSVAAILQLSVTGTAALLCYNCSNISDADECLTITECHAGQSCFMDKGTSGQSITLGCTDNQQCGVTPSLVGRGVNRQQQSQCHECCSTDKCNKNLCSYLTPGSCEDDAHADCAYMNTFFNICQDIHHAKVVCRKFCALCSLVDGHWGSWSAWSSCDVTCENGTQTRSRTCTDPAPAHGGIDCIGSNITTKSCSRKLCPVHGGWTIWSSWDVCSAACGVGLEKRHRNCSNPIPDRNGLQCFGDTLDVRICLPGPCANGGWTNWGQWGTCSVTCSDGLKSRSRTCTNPRPSPFGSYCDGDSSDVVSCRKSSCITKSTPTTPTTTTTTTFITTTTPLPTVPRSCFLCQGPPQICEKVNFPGDCPLEKQYCINTLTNFQNASRIVEMKCGTRDDCQKGWLDKYSSNDKCTSFDQAFIYTNKFSCEFCCASDNCNQFVNPPNKWHA